ncbi:MAG: hypothetical protein WBV82_21610 [Myxococcaceae bacterium]
MRNSQLLTAVFLPAALLVGCGQGQPEAEVSATELQQMEEGLITTSTPQRLATLEGGGAMRMGTTHIYFVDYENRAIRRVPKAGGAVETVFSAPSDAWILSEFALDDQYVYAAVVEGPNYFGHIVRVPLAGGEPVVLLDGEMSYGAIAVDATHVYLGYLDWQIIGSGPASQLVRFPKDGSIFLEPEVIASEQNNVSSIAVDGSNVYWIDAGGLNPANGCNPNEGKIRAWNKLSKATRIIASGENCPLNLVFDGSTLYWGNFAYELRKISAWSYFGFPQTVARDVNGLAIAADSSYLYAETGSGQPYLMAVGKLFGTRYSFSNTRGEREFYGLAADTQNLYYLRYDGSEGPRSSLFKLRK